MNTAQLQWGFSPRKYGSLTAWWDMMNPNGFTQSGGLVTSLVNLITGVGTAPNVGPPYQATGFNGRPCFDCNGTTQYFVGAEAAVVSALSDSKAKTIYIVGATDIPDSTDIFFGFGNSGQATASSGGWGCNNTSTGKWAVFNRNAANTINNDESTGANNNGNNILCWSHTTTIVSLYANGGAADPNSASASYGTVTPDQFGIMCNPRSTPAQMMNGRLAELLLFGGVTHTGAQMQQMYLYLKSKWGL